MSANESKKKGILLIGKILCLAVLASAALISGRSGVYLDPTGLLFVLIAGSAGALMTFSVPEIKAAFAHAGGASGGADEMRRSALFWEAAARNFWLLGILRSILSFVISLGSLSGGIWTLASGLANSLLAALYGMVLAAVCYVPYWKLEAQYRNKRRQEGLAGPAPAAGAIIRNWTFSHLIGYALFAAVLLATLLRAPASGIAAAGWIIYWPSLLVVFGGTLALLLFLGEGAFESAISPGFAVTGVIGCLMGSVQVLLGISAGKISDVASALTFILSSCFAALMGIFLLGAPLEDRAARGSAEAARAPLTRAAWYAFPLLALVLLVAVFLLVVTPFERRV